MAKLSLFVSANFALFFICQLSFANPQTAVPDAPREESTSPQKSIDDMSIGEPLPLAPPVPPPESHYYSYPQAFTFNLGTTNPIRPLTLSVVGFEYMFPKFLSPKLEAGAELHNDGTGQISAGARWFWHERSYFRPSLKAGLDILIDPVDGLANLASIDNFYLQMAATLEYVIWNPYSLRLEPQFFLGLNYTFMEVTLGISRGW